MSNSDSALPESAKWKQCPFNKAHMVPGSSFAKHMIKCKRSYTGPELAQCRFNVAHYTQPDEMTEHERTCKDRKIVEIIVAMQNNRSKRKLESTEDAPLTKVPVNNPTDSESDESELSRESQSEIEENSELSDNFVVEKRRKTSKFDY